MAPTKVLLIAALVCAAAAGAAAVSASTSSPLGASATPPMFILFTHDDAINGDVHDLMLEVTEGRSSVNGCPATATMFVSSPGNDCELTLDLHSKGYEIADHTKSHKSLRGIGEKKVKSEIEGGKETLTSCGVPADDVVGLRAPFLNTDETVRQVLAENNFLYESSLIEEVTGASVSGSISERVWPFTMDGGVPMNCGWFSGFQECSRGESWPGLWQVPVWHVRGAKSGVWSMDYGVDPNGDVEDALRNMFDAAYDGNRAPMPIYIHLPWLQDKEHRKAVKNFLDYALAKPDVYAVTMRQLINWMQNPVAADALTPEGLGCGLPGGAGGDLATAAASAKPSLEVGAGASTGDALETRAAQQQPAEEQPAATSRAAASGDLAAAFAAAGYRLP